MSRDGSPRSARSTLRSGCSGTPRDANASASWSTGATATSTGAESQVRFSALAEGNGCEAHADRAHAKISLRFAGFAELLRGGQSHLWRASVASPCTLPSSAGRGGSHSPKRRSTEPHPSAGLRRRPRGAQRRRAPAARRASRDRDARRRQGLPPSPLFDGRLLLEVAKGAGGAGCENDHLAALASHEMRQPRRCHVPDAGLGLHALTHLPLTHTATPLAP